MISFAITKNAYHIIEHVILKTIAEIGVTRRGAKVTITTLTYAIFYTHSIII